MKWKGMKTLPSATRVEAFDFSVMAPRREETTTGSPSTTPRRSRSACVISTNASGAMASRAFARRVMVPVCQCLQKPPGIQNKGEFIVRQFIGRREGYGHESPASDGEGTAEEDGLVKRPYHRALFHRFIGDSIEYWRQSHDLFPDFLRPPVFPCVARIALLHPYHSVGQIDQYIPVQPRFAWWLDRLPADLDHAVGVDIGAFFLDRGGSRQDHVGEFGGLRQEDVLDDQKGQVLQRFSYLVHVRVRQEGILSHHEHARDASIERAVHDLHDGQSIRRIQGFAPCGFESSAHFMVRNRLIARGSTGGSVPRPKRPARCSGRAGDAARCRGARCCRS